jgi:hypothetical protein
LDPASGETNMRNMCRSGCLTLLLLAAWLQAQSPRTSWPIADAPLELRDSITRADLIVVDMQSQLLRELSQALTRGGPAGAVNSCHVDVTGIAARIGRQSGVAAGRTSDRLRNKTNAPRAWAAPFVANYAGKQARDVDGFVVDLGDRIGVLRPIVQRPMCVSCHGPADRIDPAVRAVLNTRYPADRASGFEEGEIRGWFWVEVPKPGP